MDFCEHCDNILKIEGDNKSLYSFCNNCNLKKEIEGEYTLLSKNYVPTKELYKDIFVNKFTKFDKTLPKIDMKCTNCSVSDKIVYIRYDTENMKHIHFCTSCDTILKM